MNKHSWHDPHIIRAAKTFLKVFSVTVGTFLFLFVLAHIGGALYVSSIATKSTDAFQAGIAADLTYLKEQGDAVATNELIIKYVLSEDTQNLFEVMQKEKVDRSIGLMGVTDAEGVVLGRTKSVGKVGDNAFLVNPVGRIVADGKSAQSVEAPVGFNPRQIFLTTGRPIIYEGRMVGGLFANYLTNDAYAERFRDMYLSRGVEVVFYNKNAGIYGSSFSDVATRKLIGSYFNSSSDWITDGISGKTISFQDGSFYFIENTIFSGLEESPGGALLFIPRRDISRVLDSVIALLTLFVFIFFTLRYHVRSRGEEHGWRYYTILVVVSIPILALAFLGLRLGNTGYFRLERIPYTLYNSTIRLQPEFGIYDIDFEQRFSIVVDTGDEAINAVQIGLRFDPKLVEVTALETTGSVCSYVVENSIDVSLGSAKLSCVVSKSAGEQGSLPIADVVVVPRHSGTFTLSFDTEETKVLASDGVGTDVLRMSQSGSYQVDTFDSDVSTSTPGSFAVFSPMHSNQSRWYNSSTARFVWRGRPGVVYAYVFDSSPDTIPSNVHTTQDSRIDLPIPGDGIFYFHLRLVPGGPTVHYRLQADKTPPSIASMQLSADRVVAGDVVRFSFNAEDVGSGVQNNYYVDLGNHLFLPIGSQLFIPFLEAGNQKVILRVYDAAGNYAEKSQIITVGNPS